MEETIAKTARVKKIDAFIFVFVISYFIKYVFVLKFKETVFKRNLKTIFFQEKK